MLDVNKYFTTELKACYALVRLQDKTHDFILVASELAEPCYAFDLNQQLKKTVVWPDIGGTMTLVQIPGTMDFLATQKFYPGFDSAQCRIVRGRFNGQGWTMEEVISFPYLHRFTLLAKTAKEFYFIGCSIAKSKKTIEDWSDPGEIFTGIYHEETNVLSGLNSLEQRITKNHGFHYDESTNQIYIAGQEGVFCLELLANQRWQLTKRFSEETSDIYNTDINQDGQTEFLSIQGFHGPKLRIYNHDFSRVIYQHPTDTPFGHALWGGKIQQENYFIFGYREGLQNLFALHFHEGEIVEELIDEAVGSSNILVFEKAGTYYLASANNGKNEFAIYQMKDGGNGK